MHIGIDGSFPDGRGLQGEGSTPLERVGENTRPEPELLPDDMTRWVVPAITKVTSVAVLTIRAIAFPVTVLICASGLASDNDTTTHHTIQCDEPRKDIFEYVNGVASGVDQWSDGSMRPREYNLVGFDPTSLEAVFYTVTSPGPLGLITLFEIDFANPAVTEHRIGPDVNISFEFSGCRSINR